MTIRIDWTRTARAEERGGGRGDQFLELAKGAGPMGRIVIRTGQGWELTRCLEARTEPVPDLSRRGERVQSRLQVQYVLECEVRLGELGVNPTRGTGQLTLVMLATRSTPQMSRLNPAEFLFLMIDQSVLHDSLC